MKATFDVTVKVDSVKVETIFNMRDGVEDMDIDVIDKVTKAVPNLACMLKRIINRESPKPPKIFENLHKS